MEILEPWSCNYGFEISRYMLCSNITLVMQGYAIQRQSYWNFIRKTPARTVQLCHQTMISLIGLNLTRIFLNMKGVSENCLLCYVDPAVNAYKLPYSFSHHHFCLPQYFHLNPLLLWGNIMCLFLFHLLF